MRNMAWKLGALRRRKNPSFGCSSQSILPDDAAVLPRHVSYGSWSPPILELHMLWTIAVVLIVLWVLGMVSSYTIGGLIHILLIVAIIMILVRVIQGRKVL
jgi:Family of unknown function (DUF5670)